MYRLERGTILPTVKHNGVTYKPKRQWKLVAVFPHPVHPSAISNRQRPEENMLMGAKGQQCRVVAPNGIVLALYEWGEVDENPGDPESTRKVPGWKLIEQAAPEPQRNHLVSGAAALPEHYHLPIPSVGSDDYCTYVPRQDFDYAALTGATQLKQEE
jgi:hypothetical protein